MDILQEIDKADPVSLENLIGKTALIKTIDNVEHEGTVYVVDPISKAIVLISLNEGRRTLKIIPFHAVEHFELISGSSVREAKLSEPLFESDVTERKVRLKDWFEKNLIEVTDDDGVLRVRDDFSIGPPYTVSQCVSDNQIILERMIQLIEKMP